MFHTRLDKESGSGHEDVRLRVVIVHVVLVSFLAGSRFARTDGIVSL